MAEQPSWEDILRMMGEISSGSAEAGAEGLVESTRLGVEGALEQQRRQQEYLTKAGDQAVGYYDKWSKGGWNDYGKRMDTMMAQGAPKYSWDKEFSYDAWKTPQTWEDYSKSRLTPEGAQSSPYYGLYQYQKQQQDLASNKALAARGLYGSGAGMKTALNAQSGIDEKFAADEYGRALSEYQNMYNQKLQEHNIGYEEAKQKYGMGYEQYNKSFGVQQGQYQDKLAQLTNLTDWGRQADAAMANARLGTGYQMGQGAIQTGQTLAGLYGQQGQGMVSAYNAQGNQMAGLVGNYLNNQLGYAGLNQSQGNYNNANATNLALGGLTALSGLGRTGLDA